LFFIVPTNNAAEPAHPLVLPDAAADKAGFQAAVRKQLRLLLDGWLASLRDRGIRLLLLALGEHVGLVWHVCCNVK
jgi:hypothetical protein